MHRTGSVVPDRLPRWLLATLVLLGLAVFINYVDRGNFATAAPLIKDELHLSAAQLGFLLTAFFITYMPMQIVVGWLTDRFGAARVLLAGFIVWSLAMSLSGFAHTLATLVWLRLALGVGESVFFPASSAIVARCFPESSRGVANACIMACVSAGPAFGIFIGGLLIAGFGWRAFFVAFGLVSLIWAVPWLIVAQPRLMEQRAETSVDAAATRAILRERSLWGASLGHFCANYVLYFMLSWMPYYLVHERGWSLTQMAKIGGGTYLLMALTSLLTGWITDHWIASGASTTMARKTFLGAGSALGAIFIASCAIVGANASVFLLVLTCASFGLVGPNIFAVAQTLAGANTVGRWVGIQNCLGNVAGLIAPFLTGVLVDRTGHFASAFWIAAAISALGGAAWVFGVGPVAQIDWARRGSVRIRKVPA
ncbi:MAG: MFS transporter [Proteobacteria bacterium]|nr:MFS transporter [Pseudomonadota bacterium]